jgi:hypothetical protein
MDDNNKAYSDGYDFGFSHPHTPTHFAKKYAPSWCKNLTLWIKGFKDGKRATGLARN